jgi:hypothetical protein
MKFKMIDYTDFYYEKISGIPKPLRRAGKFVRIRHKDAEYLVFSPKEFTRFHADLVEKFCQEKGIYGFYNNEQKKYDIYDASWTILGGGKFEIDENEKVLRLYDNSMAYGKFDPAGLREKISSLKKMSGYKVNIE